MVAVTATSSIGTSPIIPNIHKNNKENEKVYIAKPILQIIVTPIEWTNIYIYLHHLIKFKVIAKVVGIWNEWIN